MSSKIERMKVFESGSTLAKHSLNQDHIKWGKDGWQRVYGRSKKQTKAEERRREIEKEDLWRRQKIKNVFAYVKAAFREWDGYDPNILAADIGFLRRNDIPFNRRLLAEDDNF